MDEQINNSSYTPTEWTVGDVITAEKMNNIENGIVNLSNGIAGVSSSSGVKLYDLVKEENEEGYAVYKVYEADGNEVELLNFFNVAYETPESVVVRFYDYPESSVENVNYYKPVKRVVYNGKITERSVEFSYVGIASGAKYSNLYSANTFVIIKTDKSGNASIVELEDQYPNSVFLIDVTYDSDNNTYVGDLSGKTCHEVMELSKFTPVAAVITKSDNSFKCVCNLKKACFDQANNNIYFCFESPSLTEERIVTNACVLTDKNIYFEDVPENWMSQTEA